MTLEGPRTMAKVLTGTTATNIESVLGSATGQWDLVPNAPNAAVQRSYFDLSGYNQKFLTTFVQGVEIQEPGPLTGDDQHNGLMEIVSTEYISDLEIAGFTGGFGFSGPGFSESINNMDQIIYARRRGYTYNTLIEPVIPNLHSVNTWGTANAVTSDKVHLTRIVFSSTTPNSVTHVSDANFVMVAIIAKEKELPFLMRQKRSYELATGP